MAEDENVDVETPEGEVSEAVESDAAKAAAVSYTHLRAHET